MKSAQSWPAIAAMAAAALLSACTFFGQRTTTPPPHTTPVVVTTMVPSAVPPSATPAMEMPTATPTSAAASPTPAQPSATPAASPSPAGPVLSETGPWLVYNTPGGLVVANADGSSPILLNTYLSEGELAAAPTGRWLAYHTWPGPGGSRADVNLGLISLPGGFVNQISPLLSSSLQQAVRQSEGAGERPPEPAMAISVPGALAWSPDGRFLAFVAALDGPSADVYTYDQSSGQLRRMSDEPGQATALTWSPDSRVIVYQATENFGTGAGWGPTAVYAADPTTGTARKLYDLAAGGPEVIIGWPASDIFTAYAFSQPLGAANLHRYHLDSSTDTQLLAGGFYMAAMDDASGIIAMVTDGALTGQSGAGGQPTFYLLLPDGTPRLVATQPIDRLAWETLPGRFFAAEPNGVQTFSLNNEVVLFPGERFYEVSPDGQHIAFWQAAEFAPNPGLRVYSPVGQLEREVTADSVAVATWAPSGAGLVYVSGRQLYYAPLAGTSVLVAHDVAVTFGFGMAWVLPGR